MNHSLFLLLISPYNEWDKKPNCLSITPCFNFILEFIQVSKPNPHGILFFFLWKSVKPLTSEDAGNLISRNRNWYWVVPNFRDAISQKISQYKVIKIITIQSTQFCFFFVINSYIISWYDKNVKKSCVKNVDKNIIYVLHGIEGLPPKL